MAAIAVSLVGVFKGLSLGSSSSSSSCFAGDFGSIHVSHTVLESFRLTIQMAHKKGAGRTKNDRDSAGKRLGVQIYGDQLAKPGAIIVRQCGTKA